MTRGGLGRVHERPPAVIPLGHSIRSQYPLFVYTVRKQFAVKPEEQTARLWVLSQLEGVDFPV